MRSTVEKTGKRLLLGNLWPSKLASGVDNLRYQDPSSVYNVPTLLVHLSD